VIPLDKKIKFTTLLPRDLVIKLKVKAASQNKNANDILIALIEKYLDKV
jgi:hypothetical protein